MLYKIVSSLALLSSVLSLDLRWHDYQLASDCLSVTNGKTSSDIQHGFYGGSPGTGETPSRKEPQSDCGKQITLTYKGKSVTVTMAWQATGGFEVSEAAFIALAGSTAPGVIPVTCSGAACGAFNSGGVVKPTEGNNDTNKPTEDNNTPEPTEDSTQPKPKPKKTVKKKKVKKAQKSNRKNSVDSNDGSNVYGDIDSTAASDTSSSDNNAALDDNSQTKLNAPTDEDLYDSSENTDDDGLASTDNTITPAKPKKKYLRAKNTRGKKKKCKKNNDQSKKNLEETKAKPEDQAQENEKAKQQDDSAHDGFLL